MDGDDDCKTREYYRDGEAEDEGVLQVPAETAQALPARAHRQESCDGRPLLLHEQCGELGINAKRRHVRRLE